MDVEDRQAQAPQTHEDGHAATRRGRWRRVLLMVWLLLMAAVVVTGTVGYLIHFFLLQS